MNTTETAAVTEAAAQALAVLEQMFGYYEPVAAVVADEEDDYALAA